MKPLFFVIVLVIAALGVGAWLLFRGSPASARFGPCVGALDCQVCRNCSRCKHCRAGGTCGVKEARGKAA